MIVETSGELTLVSARSFRGLEFIDGGDTAVVKFIGADGSEVAAMMPLRTAIEMAHALAEMSQIVASTGKRLTKC